MPEIKDKTSSPKTSILKQFLSPVLLAILIVGLSVAVISKLAADRLSRMASAMRMNNIGQIIAQSSYPKTANVLENLRNFTRLEFILVRLDPVKQTLNVDQATLKLDPVVLNHIAKSLLSEKPVSKPVEATDTNYPSKIEPKLHEVSTNNGEVTRWISFPAEPYRLIVLEPEREQSETWLFFALPLVTGMLSSVAIAMVATWTARRFSQRIESLENEVSNIAAGRFQPKAIEGPNDAIRSLHQSLYSMGEQLDESKRQIRTSERTRLIHMIGSGLAHELRNHLAGARLALQTVTVDECDAEAIEVSLKQLDLAETQIRRLLAIRPGGDSIDSAPHTVGEIRRAIHTYASPMATHHKVQLDVFSSHAVNHCESATIDDVLIRSGASVIGIVLNVVLNGIEAVSSSEHIAEDQRRVDLTVDWLSAHCVNTMVPQSSEVTQNGDFEQANHGATGMVQWIVRDNGPGPNAVMTQLMFEPFATTKREGVGLGLAMCKHVIESIGGQIEWKRENEKTVFVIYTPVHSDRETFNTNSAE